MTMNDTWGFKSYDHNWKSATVLIRNLIDIASKGGNYLLNVGPTSLGEIPGPSVERLNAIGAWMKVNSKAIYATTASPFKKLPWGRCTKVLTPKGAILYLHVFDWPVDGKLLVPGLKNRVSKASLLAGGESLEVSATPDGPVVMLPAKAPDAVSSTVVLSVEGSLDIMAPVLTQNADGTLDLRPGDATLRGSEIQTEGHGDQENIGYWTNPNDRVEWTFKAIRPGRYTLTAEVASPASPSIGLSFGRQSWRVTIPKTGSYTAYQSIDLGTIEIAASGMVTLTIAPVAEGWQPFNLRTIKMAPARP